MTTNESATPDPRIERAKLAVAVLAIIGCTAAMVYFALAIGWLSTPESWSQWAPPILMNAMIWASTLSIVLGAGGGILAVRSGQPARYFAILTAIVFVIYATAMYSMAYMFD